MRSWGLKLIMIAVLGAVAAVAAASPALASIPINFNNWHVNGSLTAKKLNEPVVLPKGSVFNGAASLELTETEASGTLHGHITVPPFKAKLKLVGLLPSEVGITFTEVGESHGTISPLPRTDCRPSLSAYCAEVGVVSKAIVGIDTVGTGGLELPTHCETSEPVEFTPTTRLTITELEEAGTKFEGLTTIPTITCSGVEGLIMGPLITALMSGPENPYVLHISETEPAPPTVVTKPATDTTQVSARLEGTVNPETELITDCHIEYGTTTSYGKSLPCSPMPTNQALPQEVQVLAAGLTEGTTYHYRVVATNALGTTEGKDETLETLGSTGAPIYGQCVAMKKGNYIDPNCTGMKTVKGVPVEHRGKFEWVPGPPASCVAAKKGEYTDSACATNSSKPHKGTFEKAPGPGFTASSGAVSVTATGLAVKCSASTGQGTITSLSGGTAQLTFTGCESAGHACTSEGADGTASGHAGQIDTNALDSRLLGPVAVFSGDQIWNSLLSAEHEPYVAEFGCNGTLYRLAGSLGGVEHGDVNTSTSSSSLAFEGPNGEQGWTVESSSDGGSTWAAASSSTVLSNVTLSYASPVEIRP